MIESNANYLKLYCGLGILQMLCSCTATDPAPLCLTPSLGNIKAPYWNKDTISLYFVSGEPSTVHRYQSDTKELISAPLDTDKPVSFVVPAQLPDVYVVGLADTMRTFSWDGKSPEKIVLDTGTRFYDVPITAGKVDAASDLWVAIENGDLYCFTNGLSRKFGTDLGKLNELAWSVHGSKIYVMDVDKTQLIQYYFSVETKSIDAPGDVLFDFKNNGFDGSPKSIYVDDKNHAWVALCGSDKIACIDTGNKTLTTTVSLAGMSISGIAFGGPNMDILYVTTDKTGTSPDAGSLFQLTGTGAKGVPSLRANMKQLILH